MRVCPLSTVSSFRAIFVHLLILSGIVEYLQSEIGQEEVCGWLFVA